MLIVETKWYGGVQGIYVITTQQLVLTASPTVKNVVL